MITDESVFFQLGYVESALNRIMKHAEIYLKSGMSKKNLAEKIQEEITFTRKTLAEKFPDSWGKDGLKI